MAKKLVKKVSPKGVSKKAVKTSAKSAKTSKPAVKKAAVAKKTVNSRTSAAAGKPVVKKAVKTVKPVAKKTAAVKKTVPKRLITAVASKSAVKMVKPTVKTTVKSVVKSTVKPAAKKVAVNKPMVKPVVAPFVPPVVSQTVDVAENRQVKPLPETKRYSPEEIDKFKDNLLLLRTRLSGNVSAIAEAALMKNRMEGDGDHSSSPTHMADVSSDNFEQENSLNLVHNEVGRIHLIDEALERVKDGTYGVCEGCGCLIPKPRLNYIPYALMCVKCTEKADKKKDLY
jgi:RNA polymerase-binding transcription factor DksA